jgi:hypothetical protein
MSNIVPLIIFILTCKTTNTNTNVCASFSSCDVVTLLGAHTLGHVHVAFSGYGFANATTTTAANILTNAWDNTPSVFDNNYFSDHINLVSKSPNRFRINRNLIATFGNELISNFSTAMEQQFPYRLNARCLEPWHQCRQRLLRRDPPDCGDGPRLPCLHFGGRHRR